ncbi:hypothetical protein U2F26_26170 [Micromonospora sp. 4G57]|uniref:Uncharacterized protein n=1 Tax=Micromonospora sicca TaxID=2202420 RepID=A0ABU5JH34_9ACTN|nr:MULTISPECIES: hypothetical protein [unclassified Micromonospora]MDZ5446178.1 hypothetical protein [Micromonospora sp. 4G57]MDZ5491938.1 hypothetical protein [Micromonospora sp. 4G53]
MTDLYPAADQRELLRQAAAAHTAASRDVETYLRQLPDVPDPADITEYANLLTREERARLDRQAAADGAGLQLPSMESE